MCVMIIIIVIISNFCTVLFSERNELTLLYTLDTASFNNKTEK